MRLLFDQNLSHKLCSQLLPVFDGSAHLRDFGLAGADDGAVCALAHARRFTLVSFDKDFVEIVERRGPPPKLVWLRCRNQPTRIIAGLLNDSAVKLLLFEQDRTASRLELG